MAALNPAASSLISLPPFDAARWREDRAARLARMSAGARPDPRPGPYLIRIPVRRAGSESPAPPPVTRDTSVLARHDNGTVTYRRPHWVPTRDEMLAVRNVLAAVAQHYGFGANDLRAPNREPRVVRARHMACWMLRDLKRLSLPEIGRAMGGRDHSTASNSCARVDAKIARGDPETLATVAAIRAKLGASDDVPERKHPDDTIVSAMVRRALTGEPWSFAEMLRLFEDRDAYSAIDKTHQRWRAKGWAWFVRAGTTAKWSLTEAGRAALQAKEM